MTRTTSAEAHRRNKESGYLSKRQEEVRTAFDLFGPMTQTELAERSGIPGAWKRVSELVDRAEVCGDSQQAD